MKRVFQKVVEVHNEREEGVQTTGKVMKDEDDNCLYLFFQNEDDLKYCRVIKCKNQ